jgi:hypothetical protein
VRSSIVALLVAAALVAPPEAVARPKDPSEAVAKAVRFGTPRPVAISWTELVVDVPVRVHPVGVSGRVESVTFTNLRLNGIPFEVDPYTASFDLPDKRAVDLPRPLRLRVRFSRVAPGVIDEALMPSDSLALTGSVAVSGSFKKWFLSVRRTVDVPIDERGPNPIAEYHPLRLMLVELERLERSRWWSPF